MDRVVIYLRTALFSVGGPHAHVPPRTLIVEATVLDRPASGLVVRAERLLDEEGRELSKAEVILLLPWGKIDHLRLFEAPTPSAG